MANDFMHRKNNILYGGKSINSVFLSFSFIDFYGSAFLPSTTTTYSPSLFPPLFPP